MYCSFGMGDKTPIEAKSGGFKIGELAKDQDDEGPKVTADIACKSGGFSSKDCEENEGAKDNAPLEAKSGGFKPTPGDPNKTYEEVPKETNKGPVKASAVESVAISPEDAKKRVKTAKNLFTLNRLLLMLMDVQPDSLSLETIGDLKKVYALLINIHAEQKPR